MRKTSAALTLIALSALALVGCAPEAGSSNSFGCAPSDAGDTSALSTLEVSGDLGTQVQVELAEGINIPAAGRSVLISGEGRQITEPGQLVQMSYTMINSATGEVMNSGFIPSSPAFLSSPFTESLMCERAGSRVAFTVPATQLDEAAMAQQGIGATQGIVVVADVIDVGRSRADGAPVFNSTLGMPSVVRATDGRPGIVVPDSAAPATTTVQTLLKGDGEALTAEYLAGNSIVVHYTAVGWDSGAVTGSSWADARPVVASQNALPTQVLGALEGATLGSQLMVIISAADATAAGISAGGAVVYVVDVLAGVPAQ